MSIRGVFSISCMSTLMLESEVLNMCDRNITRWLTSLFPWTGQCCKAGTSALQPFLARTEQNRLDMICAGKTYIADVFLHAGLDLFLFLTVEKM